MRDVREPLPVLSVDSGRPLFALRGLRHGDRAVRCVGLTNEGPGEAFGSVLGRSEGGDLGRSLRLAVTRGCDGGTVLFSGRLDEFERARDDEPWPAGARRTYGLAVEVVGSDEEVQGRRAGHEFAFASERPEGDPAPAPAAGGASSEQPPAAAQPACTSIAFAPSGGRRRRPVLIKRHRVDARVTAKLILRIYGAPGAQRLVLVTGLRVGRTVLMGRDWGRVSYRVAGGAAVTSTRRPFRVRIAPGALRPGRNVVRVTVVPRHGRAVRARYVLRIAAPPIGGTSCVIG
ncbi:MAG TPA: hypothetical protein VGW75_18555 [Solirubrobacteraceae bacterium]|nr:hypothetical protein [Solirubrobacteraceae bacterium]